MQKSKNEPLRGITYGYARVSTDRQAEHGVSMQAQLAKIHAMGAIQDAVLVETIKDTESAKTLNRPGLQRLLAIVEAGRAQTVIVSKLDRLTRSVRDLADILELFEKRNVSLVSVAESLDTGTPAGRLVLNIMVSVSQWEREAIGERTAVALRHKRTMGQAYTRIDPYGYVREGGQLIPLETEQKALSHMRQLRTRGWSLRRIATALEAAGVPTKQGTRWHPQTLKDILENPLHATA